MSGGKNESCQMTNDDQYSNCSHSLNTEQTVITNSVLNNSNHVAKSSPNEYTDHTYSSGQPVKSDLISPDGSIMWNQESEWIMLYDSILNAKQTSFNQFGDCICRQKFRLNSFNKDNQRLSNDYDKTDKMSLNKANVNENSKRLLPTQKYLLMGNSAGATDEEMFIKSFEDVPEVTITNGKELESELVSIKNILSESGSDWRKKVDSMKRLRSFVKAGAVEYKEFLDFFKTIDLAFQCCVKDLRSQVVRESCLTIAYLSQKMGLKCGRFCEALLPNLVFLIPNSAKIMSSSAIVTIRFIIEHTRSPRLIPIITYNLNSKSKEIRRFCCEFLDQMLHTWSTHCLEKHVHILTEAVKKGISDADSEARFHSRKAFWGFSDHFKDQADTLLDSLDSSKQRILQGEQANMGINSLYNSVTRPDGPSYLYPTKASLSRTPSSMSSASIENINRPSSSLSNRYRTGISQYSTPRSTASGVSNISPLRSTSAIDMGALRRAKARAAVAAITKKPNVSNADSVLSRGSVKKPMISKSSTTSTQEPNYVSSERSSRVKTRISQSQPGSRSVSPLPRSNYSSNQVYNRGIRRRNSINDKSRDTSPFRSITSFGLEQSGNKNLNRNEMINSHSDKKTLVQTRPFLAEKVLQQSQEAEQAVASALKAAVNFTPRHRYSFDDFSDGSDTSSVCSDRSFGGRNIEEISDIMRNLSSTQWIDKKEALLDLEVYLRLSPVSLTSFQLKRITDILAKMLLDPHIKNYSLFFKVLNDLLSSYRQDLKEWIYPVMTRLFLKLGQVHISSLQSKINKTLDHIFNNFPRPDQLNIIIRFLSDQSQSINEKSKISVLAYLIRLSEKMDSIECLPRDEHQFQLALMKIISWTADPKSQELRRYSREALISLIQVNRQRLNCSLYQLPKTYQDAAFQLIRNKHGTSPNSNYSSINNITNSNSPFFGNGNIYKSLIDKYGADLVDNFDETENLNPEEIYNSLLRTTDEIQKYKFDSIVDKISTDPWNLSTSPSFDAVKEKELISKKMAASQLETGLKPSPSNSLSSLLKLSSTDLNQNLSNITVSSTHSVKLVSNQITNLNGTSGDDGKKSYSNIITELKAVSNDCEAMKSKLNQLIGSIRDEEDLNWSQYFQELLQVLFNHMTSNENSSIRILCLKAICELLIRQPDQFNDYTNLTVSKLLEASKDHEKEVQRGSESAVSLAAAIFSPKVCLDILHSVIKLSDLAVNQVAIKLLTKLIERQEQQMIESLLPQIMPPLIEACSNPESSIRKSSVFSLVAIHSKVGDKMQPYLDALNGSKLKLLKLYIDRSKNQSNEDHPSMQFVA